MKPFILAGLTSRMASPLPHELTPEQPILRDLSQFHVPALMWNFRIAHGLFHFSTMPSGPEVARLQNFL
eukprot:7397810-Pyramimonas_sp.AAC.1